MPTASAGRSTSWPGASPTSEVDRVVGVEARGFILAAPVAYRLGASFVPVRKPGKLPWAVVREEYQLEYGTDRLEIHRDAIRPDERILVVDDVLATGGTAAATCRLVEALGGVDRRRRHPDRVERAGRSGHARRPSPRGPGDLLSEPDEHRQPRSPVAAAP